MQGGMRSLARRMASSYNHGAVRRLRIEPGAREKALLEEDPAFRNFKSTKATAEYVKKFGDVLVLVVAAGCLKQIYDVWEIRKAEQKSQDSTES